MYLKGKDQIYMFDRDNTVFKVNNLTFPRRKSPEECVFDTLVDGVRMHFFSNNNKRH